MGDQQLKRKKGEKTVFNANDKNRRQLGDDKQKIHETTLFSSARMKKYIGKVLFFFYKKGTDTEMTSTQTSQKPANDQQKALILSKNRIEGNIKELNSYLKTHLKDAFITKR